MIRDKLVELFREIPVCIVNVRAAQGLIDFKRNLSKTKHNLAAEREELAEKQALELRKLRRKTEDEKRRLEDLDEDIPVPPEHDFVPPKRSMFKKPKRDAEGDCAMQGQEPPQYNDNDEDDDRPVPPSEDFTPPMQSLMRSMRARAARREEEKEEKKHDAPVTISTQAPTLTSNAQGFCFTPAGPGYVFPTNYSSPLFSPPVAGPAHLPQLSNEEWASQLSKIFSSHDDDTLATLAQKSLGVVNNSRPDPEA